VAAERQGGLEKRIRWSSRPTGNHAGRAGLLAWSLSVLSAALSVGAWVVVHSRQPNPEWPWPTYPTLISLVPFLALCAVGALIASRRPDNILGWLFCTVSLVASFAVAGRLYVVAFALPAREPAALAVGLASNLGLVLLTYSLLLFPDGRLPSPAWRPFAWIVFGAVGVCYLAQALEPGELQWFVGVDNPLGVSGLAVVSRQASDLSVLLLGVALASAALSLVLRWRRAHGIERQQIKWLAFVAVLLFGALTVMLAYNWYAGAFVMFAGLTALPLAVGIAILRYRLYDIDIIINRTLVYGTVTAVLAGVFAALSILTQRVVLAITGQESQAAVVIAALVVTALFQPLRARVQIVVERRFYRRKYDTAQTLERFASQVRDKFELDQLTTELVAVVRETMQPAHASLWLRPRARSQHITERQL
jgi:hypothetical protein